MKKILYLAVLTIFAACNPKEPNTPDTPDANAPKSMSYSIISTYPHDTSSYTQGLLFYKGELYEGTGLEGKSKLMKLDLKTGTAIQKINLDELIF